MSRLLRIVLIDSLCAGDKAEVLVDANTCLTGTNGIGKSTFLKLIPLFYGASAGRMVKAGTNTSSFADHYLPSFTSYIVFEYLNHENVPRCAVLHRSSSGYAYRLISSPWDAELLYVDQTIGLLVEPSSLQRRAANMRIDCTPELTPRDYLRVIQYNTGVADLEGINSSDRKRLIAALRRTYSLAPFRHHFGGIDNLMFSLLESKGTFDSMKSAMKEILQQETGVESVDLSGMDLAAFTGAVDSRASYLIMESRIRPLINRLSELHPRLVTNEGQQGRLKRIAADQHEKALAGKVSLQEQIEEARKRESTATDVYNDKNEAVQERLGARVGQREAVADVEKLTAQRADFEKSIIPSLMNDYISRTAIEEGLRVLNEEHTVLVDQGQGIQHRYERLEGDLIRSVLERKAKRTQEADSKQADLRTQSHAQLEQLEQQTESVREKHAAELEAHDGKNTILATALAEHRKQAAFLESIRLLPEAAEAIQNEQKAVQAIRDELDKIAVELTEHEAEQRRFAKDQQAVADDQQHLVSRREQLRAEVNLLSRQLNPSDDTLLAFLRAECPAWEQSIARVINPEILLRSDLSPTGTLDTSGFYGIQLDLDRLQPVAQANSDAIESSLALANQHLVEIEEEQQHLSRKAAGLSEQRRLHQAGQAEIVGRQNKHLENIKALQGLISTLEQDGAEQIAHERSLCSSAVAEALQQLNLHGTQRQELKDTQREYVENLKAIVERIKAETAAQLGEIDRLKKAACDELDQEKEEKLKSYHQARLNELTEAGVDAAIISKLEEEMAAINAKLTLLSQYQSELRNYQLWLKDDLPKLPALEAARLQAAGMTSRILDEVRELVQARNEQVSAFRAAQSALNEQLSQIEVGLLILSSVLKRLEFTPFVNSDLDSLRKLTAADIESEVGRLQRDAQSQRTEGRNLFRKIELEAMGGPRDTAEYDAIQDIATRSRHADATGERAWFHATPELLIYLAEGHDVQRSKLITRTRALCTQVAENQSVLNGLHRSIMELGRKATKKVNEVLAAFPQFTNFEFRVVSRIHDISAWDDIDALVDQYNRWRVKPAGEIPTDALNERLISMQRRMKAGGWLSTKLADCFDVSLSWMVNGVQKVAFNTADLGDGLSTGQLKIIVGMIYQALFELIRRDADFDLLLPIDEALELDVNNAYTLLKYFNARNSQLMLGFPGGAPELIRHFTHLYALDRRPSGAVYVKQYQAPETDRLAALNEELELDEEQEIIA